MQHPFKILIALILMLLISWGILWLMMNARTCCVCGSIRMIPNIDTQYPFYCTHCVKEID